MVQKHFSQKFAEKKETFLFFAPIQVYTSFFNRRKLLFWRDLYLKIYEGFFCLVVIFSKGFFFGKVHNTLQKMDRAW